MKEKEVNNDDINTALELEANNFYLFLFPSVKHLHSKVENLCFLHGAQRQRHKQYKYSLTCL